MAAHDWLCVKCVLGIRYIVIYFIMPVLRAGVSTLLSAILMREMSVNGN